jgi:hypothetical protein
MKGIKCHLCNQLGHYARDCTATPINQFRVPQKKGEPNTKAFKMADGTMSDRHWCARCQVWNTTHQTSAHRSRAEMAAEKAAEAGGPPVGGAAVVETTPPPPGPAQGKAKPSGRFCLPPGEAKDDDEADNEFKVAAYAAQAMMDDLWNN